jgi:hypothetical protein
VEKPVLIPGVPIFEGVKVQVGVAGVVSKSCTAMVTANAGVPNQPKTKNRTYNCLITSYKQSKLDFDVRMEVYFVLRFNQNTVLWIKMRLCSWLCTVVFFWEYRFVILCGKMKGKSVILLPD